MLYSAPEKFFLKHQTFYKHSTRKRKCHLYLHKGKILSYLAYEILQRRELKESQG